MKVGAVHLQNKQARCAAHGGVVIASTEVRRRRRGASLRVSSPLDRSEREADRIGRRVLANTVLPTHAMRSHDQDLQRCAGGCRCDETIHNSNDRVGTDRGSITRSDIAGMGAGQALSPDTRRFFEPRFGADLSQVKLHIGSRANDLTGQVGAQAFTYHQHIAFSTGAYQPASRSGRQLLSHELAHVFQQRHSPSQIYRTNGGPVEESSATRRQLVFQPKPLQSIPKQPSEQYSESCVRHIGTCEYYRCRQRNTGNTHLPTDYYTGFGLKYCERFSKETRPRMSPAGRLWVDDTLTCLQLAAEKEIPIDAPPEVAKPRAFDTHPTCYVRSGVCFLPSSDWAEIYYTIDSKDQELRQALITGVYCAGNVVPIAVMPIHSLAAGGGYQGLMERDRRRAFDRGHDASSSHPFPPLPANHRHQAGSDGPRSLR